MPLTAAAEVKSEVRMKFDFGKRLEVRRPWFEQPTRALRLAALLDAEAHACKLQLSHDKGSIGAQEPANVVDGGAAAPRRDRGLLTRLLEVRP